MSFVDVFKLTSGVSDLQRVKLRSLHTTVRFSYVLSVAATLFALILSPGPASAGDAPVKLESALSQSVMKIGETGRAFLRVSLRGIEPPPDTERTPANIALVIDNSGSMTGAKIEDAREAARMAVGRLGPDDTIAVVSFNHTVDIVLPATSAEDIGDLRRAIDSILAGGRTALYAGVETGIEQVLTYLDPYQVNRVILLSDGLANVGPTSPDRIAALARDAAKDGVTITTIGLGLGYNEDLMTRLALNSDGNHAFVEHPDDLIDIFNMEFGDVFSVVGQQASVKIDFPEGVEPVRTLGRPAEIDGQKVTFDLRQIYGGQEKYLIVEVEIDATASEGTIDLAEVTASYTDVKTKKRRDLKRDVTLVVSDDPTRVEASRNKEVLAAATKQIATERSELAVKLRDSGEIEEAKKILRDSAADLKAKARALAAPELKSMADEYESDAAALSSGSWTRQRKQMRSRQYKGKTQQRY